MTGPLGYANMGITVGKNLHNLCSLFILGILVVPREVKTVIMQNFFLSSGGGGGGWGRGQTRYILGNRYSASGELLNKIVITEGSLGTSF